MRWHIGFRHTAMIVRIGGTIAGCGQRSSSPGSRRALGYSPEPGSERTVMAAVAVSRGELWPL